MSIVFENVKIECYDNEYILSDLKTGKMGFGESLEAAYSNLLEENEMYEGPSEEERRERIAGLLEMMLEEEEARAMILMGLLSSDNNREPMEIEENRKILKMLKEGAAKLEVSEEKAKVLSEMEEILDCGLSILDRDEKIISEEELLEELLGNKIYDLRSKYRNYFDAEVVSYKGQKDYIYEKFGECKEPTYDPLWHVWYLGQKNQSGELYYDIGSAQEIVGRVVDCPISGSVLWKKDGKEQSRAYGPLDFLIGEVWKGKKLGYETEFEDEDVLSEIQKELVRKIKEYKIEE